MSAQPDWYEDPNMLLAELRRSRHLGGRPPIIPGYADLHELGRGGQGVVYRAVQRSTGQRVAIKVLSEGAFPSLTSRRRFEREIEVVTALRHPNIVRVYDSGTTPDGRLYSVMEYIEGERLDEWIADGGLQIAESGRLRDAGEDSRKSGCETPDRFGYRRTPQGRAGFSRRRPPDHCSSQQRFTIRSDKVEIEQQLRLFEKICDAVHYAHQRGVVHRDLKPGNIRIDPGGEPHVLDFGLAKDVAGAAESLAVTASGQFMGSLPWASPEQANGFPDGIDVRTDVYSLGVILYQMLTGRFPYEVGGPIRDVLNRILTAEPIRPRTFNKSINDELETIILKPLAKEPERRYQSAGELSADIRRFLAGEPIEAKRDSASYVLRKNLRRYRWPLGIAAAFVVLLTAATVVAWVLYGETEKQRAAAVEASERLARDNYANQIALAFRSYQEGNMGEMRRCLEGCATGLREWEWSYLDRLANLSDVVFRGHREAVNIAAFSPDGKQVMSAGLDKTLRLWDADSGQELQTFPDHNTVAYAVAFSPDGTQIFSGSADGALRIWNPRTGANIRTIKRGHGAILSLAISPSGDIILCGHGGGAITQWNATTGEEIGLLPIGRLESVQSLQFSSDGRRLVCGSADAVLVWDMDAHEVVRSFPSSPAEESEKFTQQPAGFCCGDTRVFAVGPRFVINVWDIATGRIVHTFTGHTDLVSSVASSPDGQWLISAGRDMTIRVWDLEAGKETWILRGHENCINSVAISPDGRRIASCGDDRTVRIWHHPLAENGRNEVDGPVFTVRGCEVTPTGGCMFRPDGGLFVVGAGFASSWDCRTGEAELLPFQAHSSAIAVSPDDCLIVYGFTWFDVTADGLTGRVKVLRRAPPNEQVWASDMIPGAVYSLVFSPDGRWIAAGSADPGPNTAARYGVDVFDVGTGRRLHRLRGHAREVRFVALDKKGTRIASGGDDGAIRIWDAADGRELAVWQADDRGVNCVQFSEDGHWIASAGSSGACKLWDAVTGREIRKFAGHGRRALSLAFHPSGRRLVSAGEDEKAKIWDIETGRELLSIKGDAGARCVLFSPDGETLVAAGNSGDSLQILETARPSTELLARRHALGEAQRMVDALYRRGVLPDEAVELLSDDSSGAQISHEVRKAAIRYAELRGRDAHRLDTQSWGIAQHPPRTDLATEEERQRQEEGYQYAARLSEYICRELAPDNVEYRHTLGVAQYRAGLYEDAYRTLNETTLQRGGPQDLAFLAMTLIRMGRIDEARARIVEAGEKANVIGLNRSEYYRFIEEAQALLDEPPAIPQTP